MAPRTSWKGFVKLSLVSVPVRAFTAHETSEEVHLNQLHKDCHQRIRYKKVCPEHGEVKQSEIVSGYEYAKDQYVVIDPQEVAKLRKEPDRSVTIDGFITSDQIDPIYYAGKSYYLLPDGPGGTKAYGLLVRGMVDAGVHGVARIVLSGREQVVVLRPVDDVLAVNVLSYAQTVRSASLFHEDLPDQKLSKSELQLTQTLIEASRIAEFDFESYADDYVEKLQKIIEAKIEGREVVEAPDREEPKILNLMDALKKSVAEARTGERKLAPSARSKATRKAAKKATRRKKSG